MLLGAEVLLGGQDFELFPLALVGQALLVCWIIVQRGSRHLGNGRGGLGVGLDLGMQGRVTSHVVPDDVCRLDARFLGHLAWEDMGEADSALDRISACRDESPAM